MSLLEQTAQWATIFGAPCAVIALVYAGHQIHKSVVIARGQFMLELERILAYHDAVHIRLRPGGEWADPGSGPEDSADWAALEDYMGFFEHCELLLQAGSIQPESFKALFGYRVENIIENENIVQAKLHDEKEGWVYFLKLLDRLGCAPLSEAS